VLAQHPEMAAAHFNLGAAYAHIAQTSAKNDKERKALFTQAADSFRATLRLKADWPEAQNNLGVALGMLGMFKEAIAAHAEAVRLKPDYAGALFNLGFAYRKSGDKKRALETYEKLKAINPGLAEKLYLLVK